MVPQQQRRRRRRAALPRTSERRVIVARGPGGFGFTIAGQRPCVVSAVAASGPAERAGLRAGDALLAVDGASVARASHASVARLVAAAPGAIALSVAPREAPPTDTEDTEPDERARTRRRHPPPRRRPMPMMHHPGCHAAPSTSGVNEILQNLSRAQLTPSHAARLECRAVVGYLGTIETPQAASTAAPGDVRSAVRKLRQERRPATPVLLSVLPNVLLLRRPTGQALAQYSRERIVYAGCGSDADRRYFGLVTSAEMPEAGTSHSCHVFAVDPRMAEHEAHLTRAREFQIACTRDPVAERCLEFPPSAEYVVGVIRGMYSLPPDDSGSPTLQQLSKLAVKDDSPAMGNFSRCNRAVFRVPRDRRPCRHEDARLDGQEFVANSPQPSNHSEITTTSSNSDSGIGFHNDCRNIADRILVVDFAGPQPPPNRFRQEMPRRPMGLVGCSSFDADGSFLSNTTPVVDGFGGQGRPLNLDDVILNSNDLQPVRHVSPRNDDDNYNYNNVYGNLPSTSRCNGAVYDQVYTENESHYELLPPQLDLELDRVVETFNSVEIYEERPRQADCHSNESVENVTVISGGTSKASMDSVSVYSSRSHEEARPARRRHLQASLDDMLVLGLRDPPPARDKDDDANFVHPASIKCKVRKSIKPLNILSRTRNMLSKDREKKDRRRAISASAGDVTAGGGGEQDPLPAAASEPDLRDTQSEQSSPFRRWTTGSGAGSSYRHTDHRNLYTKQQMSEGSPVEPSSSATGSPRGQWPNGGVARWSLGLEQLLADPVGAAAFAAFLAKEFAHENIAFWYSCEAYSKVHDPAQRARLAKDIWDRHLAEGAMEPVNIDATARRAAVQRLNLDPPPQDLFSQAQRHVFNIMKLDSYPRFLRSGVHAECARADLRGQSPPYGPYGSYEPSAPVASGTPVHPFVAYTSPDPSVSSDFTPGSTPTKLKKSASNVSERRRSGGGASLLPWKLRVSSRDRSGAGAAGTGGVPASAGAGGAAEHPAQASGPLASGAHAGDGASSTAAEFLHPPLTDVVKSGALCRVVLPDGATSVVGVEAAVPVRRLVDRLLQRRNLLAVNYDVLLKDCQPGETAVIDASSPSTVLGGREVVVERRCVVRMEVGGRCVAVRCRPARRLRHVLRPVLARYAAPSAAPRAVLKDGSPVHPDTAMQDLDGCRLVVVELTEGGECARERARDYDTDSLSDLAVRVHDDTRDDEQGSAANRTARVEAPAGTAAAPGAPGTSGARVRAALRAGAPLHHHPPDFLENLRETQRQRLQNKNEPSPAPRTPPPLPPKPSARAPTLV
ncbi:regulator of G-protein signaling loco isoform X3 [Pectinophora gossypiella]|uniref:regulator of G-protein signaling loco isoform X3 n=1 Tax=Pectinophora gossypiella TaxID=13191 RepID=UPI00214F3C56|nr:regulator of G-protein signaling loco isoform X3 [Pectinophora gossypiella]